MGTHSNNRVKNVFNLSLLIYGLIAVCVVIVGITVGGWIVRTQLIIPPDKLDAATIVLYAMVISLGLTFIFLRLRVRINCPRKYENIRYLGVFDALAKLGIAYCIMCVENRLIVYAILMILVQLIPKIIMVIYCTKMYRNVDRNFIGIEVCSKKCSGLRAGISTGPESG